MPKLQDAPGLLAPANAIGIGTQIRIREAARELGTKVERKVYSIVSCELYLLAPLSL